MNRGSRLVEQLLGDGTVVMDTDCALSPRELQQAVSAHIPWLRSDHGLLLGEYAGRPCCIFAKNVTYLGNPHPLYKKRIQIPAGFLDLYRRGQACGIETLLWGVYTHGDVRLFCDFDLTQYVEHNLHNSSAHVYTLDLQRALKAGIVQKVDSRGNRITVFDAEHIGDFFRWKFGAAPVRQPSFLQVFDDFFSHLDKDWDGIRCYDEMAADNYRNTFQPEWPGFYLEYRFEKYLAEQAGLSHRFRIASAATSAEETGNPVYPPARRKLAEHGIGCAGKTARQLRREDYENWDLFIGMDGANLRNMRRLFDGDPEGKCSLLLDHTQRPGEVADPWYTGDFEATWQDVLAGCSGLLKSLQEHSEGSRP